MMSKLPKNISVFFLWLAGLTLSAHQLIPHDHHIANAFSYQDKNCPASNNKSNHNSGFPVHCYAFNDIASEKSRPSQISKNFQFSYITFSNLTDTISVKLQGYCTGLVDFSKLLFDSYVLELSLLRAPPTKV